jgi:hypothetical protein
MVKTFILGLMLAILLIVVSSYALQQVPDTQILLTTNTLTTITGVTNLNDLIYWLDTQFGNGLCTNIDYTTWTGQVWFLNGMLTNSVP